MELEPLQGGAALACVVVLSSQTLLQAACSPCCLNIDYCTLPAQVFGVGTCKCFVSDHMIGKVCAKQLGAPLLYLGERIRWLPLTTFRTHGVTGSSPASEASPELLMPLKVELCRAANGKLIAATAGSRLLQAHSVPTSDKACWSHCCVGAALQSLTLPLQARARPRSSMQAMPGLQEIQQLATDVFDITQLQKALWRCVGFMLSSARPLLQSCDTPLSLEPHREVLSLLTHVKASNTSVCPTPLARRLIPCSAQPGRLISNGVQQLGGT